MDGENVSPTDKRLAAVCGLYCRACTLYIATHEEPERRQRIAKRWGCSVEEAVCDGCRSDRRFAYCQTCVMFKCAAEKGLDFCGDCADYPCEELRKFQVAMPHRLELWENQDRIREVGFEVWLAEKAAHYSCPECRTINSAYDLSCWKCGASPGSAFAHRHKDRVLAYLSGLK